MSDYRMPDGTIPVLLSSDSADGVRAEAAAILNYLDARPGVAPNRVADMLFRTRTPRRYRTLAMVSTREDLLDALRAIVAEQAHPAVVAGDGAATARRIGLVFPGQGSQRPGMGTLYYECSPHYRGMVDECAAIYADRFGDTKPLHYLLGHTGEFDDTVQEIQPALMFHMLGLSAMWRASGVVPDATIGHSQGEFAASAVSGVMTLRDAVLGVTLRARMVARISPKGYSMAVLGMNREACESLLARHSGWAELSVVNSPSILAISGDRDTIVEMVALANSRGHFAKEIRVAYPAHTSIVSEYRADLEVALGDEMSGSHFQPGEIPSYGSTLGEAITPDLRHDQYWYWNLRNRVRFDYAVVAAATAGIDTLVEVAEHPTLQLALQENLTLVPKALASKDFRVIGSSLRTATSLREFTMNLAQVAVHALDYRWEALRSASEGPIALPLKDFPHTVLNNKRLWASAGVAAVAAAEPDRMPPKRLVEQWVPLERRALVAPRRLAIVDHTGRCADLAAALVTAADRHGASAFVFDEASEMEFDTALVLLPELPETDGAGAVPDLARFFAERAWLPALDRLRPGTGAECWLVTVGGEAVRADDPVPHLFHGAVAAGYRSVGLEHTGVLLRHLDLPVGAGAEQAVKLITTVHTSGENELALRNGKVFVKRCVPDSAPESDSAAMDLGHVLILGGTGQLGMRFCEHFAAAGATRITLLSRSGATESIAADLQRIRELGDTEIDIVRCDISDPVAVARFVADITHRPVSLLIHAAVNYVDADLGAITPDMVATASTAKVIGLELLLDALPMSVGCRVLLCSSIAAVLGGRGQILYAMTNRMLDITARRLRARGIDAVSIEWGLWTVAGSLDVAGFDRTASTGVLPMHPEDAIAAGLTRQWGDALVAAADWRFLSEVADVYGQAGVLSSIVAEPATEPDVIAIPAPVSALEPVAVVVPGGPPLAERMLTELRKVMGVDSAESIDHSVPLVALGLDSLQALDFRKRIRSEMQQELPVAAILGGASLDDVLQLMAQNTN
ncbi:nocobactin polyketide synthase NbtC [Nocardia sp. NPDC051832]|uniref:nocobactin polyketide synthase NbtC n=1 Tax=Nocardia sp. NPDC051832 TaxID=3155673 RepID=UPI0034192D0B